MSKAKRFRVPLIRMHNIMGIGEEIEIKPGALTLVRGKNGLGKTSLIKGVLAALGRGNPANLLRDGETEGEVVIVLDDGQGEPHLNVTAKVTAKGVEREVGYPGTPPMARTQERLAEIRNEFSLFPATFLTDTKEKRLATFLNAIPLSVDRTDLAPLLKFLPKPDQFNSNRHAFVVLNELEKLLYDKRHDVNAVVTDKRKTIKTLEATLPAGGEDLSETKARLDELKKRVDANRATYESELEIGNADFNKAKDELTAWFNKEKDALTARYNSEIDLLNTTSKEHAQELSDAYNRSAQTIGAEVATLEEQCKTFDRTIETRTLIATMNLEANNNADLSESLTNALDVDLADIRSALLEQVPIEGVSVVDGDIYVKSPQGKQIPFDSVNTRERIRVCVDLALLKAGPLNFILLDGAEALDQDSLDHMADILEARGAQCLASYVTNEPKLSVGGQ